MTTSCPSCQSANTKRARLVFEQECRTGTSQTSGLGVSLSGEVIVGGARSVKSSLSALGQRAAPPDPPVHSGVHVLAYAAIIIGTVLGGGSLIVGHDPDTVRRTWIVWLLVGIASFAAGIFYAIVSYKQSEAEHVAMMGSHFRAMQSYEAKWFCMQCGQSFQPEAKP